MSWSYFVDPALMKGSIVEQIEVDGDRLHYKLLWKMQVGCGWFIVPPTDWCGTRKTGTPIPTSNSEDSTVFQFAILSLKNFIATKFITESWVVVVVVSCCCCCYYKNISLGPAWWSSAPRLLEGSGPLKGWVSINLGDAGQDLPEGGVQKWCE